MISRTNWHCVNSSCNTVLGTVVDNDLVINTGVVMKINTSGTALSVMCASCGSPKTWYPSTDNAIMGAYRATMRDIMRALR